MWPVSWSSAASSSFSACGGSSAVRPMNCSMSSAADAIRLAFAACLPALVQDQGDAPGALRLADLRDLDRAAILAGHLMLRQVTIVVAEAVLHLEDVSRGVEALPRHVALAGVLPPRERQVC